MGWCHSKVKPIEPKDSKAIASRIELEDRIDRILDGLEKFGFVNLKISRGGIAFLIMIQKAKDDAKDFERLKRIVNKEDLFRRIAGKHESAAFRLQEMERERRERIKIQQAERARKRYRLKKELVRGVGTERYWETADNINKCKAAALSLHIKQKLDNARGNREKKEKAAREKRMRTNIEREMKKLHVGLDQCDPSELEGLSLDQMKKLAVRNEDNMKAQKTRDIELKQLTATHRRNEIIRNERDKIRLQEKARERKLKRKKEREEDDGEDKYKDLKPDIETVDLYGEDYYW
ncbi:hypothetical protein FSP39_016097 [Pinctada imbricata]|uniref:Uncharacterized protein n=1 Tax=Pinctada imbricata TaxID=66713 RepID=A0AA88YDG0_PINIB|nr:hypothetical protein FSP39_016097 [Pinctada imbricata]